MGSCRSYRGGTLGQARGEPDGRKNAERSRAMRITVTSRALALPPTGWRGLHFASPSTNVRASRASANQSASAAESTASHSFITRPDPGSNRTPTPDSDNASTLFRGSFTTKLPFDETIAKIFPPTQSAEEPKPRFAAPTVTPRLRFSAATISSNFAFASIKQGLPTSQMSRAGAKPRRWLWRLP